MPHLTHKQIEELIEHENAQKFKLMVTIGMNHPFAVVELAKTCLAALERAEELEKERLQFVETFKWLYGVNGDFPQSEPGKRYNWRTPLRERLPADILTSIEREAI